MQRWRDQLESAVGRWMIIDVSDEDVVMRYGHLFDNSMPRFLLGPDTRLGWKNLPYMYHTVKGKCFAGSQEFIDFGEVASPIEPTNTCKKIACSCYCNIVSFSAMPGKAAMRSVSRGL